MTELRLFTQTLAVLFLFFGWLIDQSLANESNATSSEMLSPKLLAYETSAYELAPECRDGDRLWQLEDWQVELRRRAAWEKSRRELQVTYYRIGYTLAFPLPLATRPAAESFPPGIATITYPWLTWLSWELEERWRTLLAAWQLLGDEEARTLLEQELAALDWENYRGDGNQVGLPTGHFAAVFALVLGRSGLWKKETVRNLEHAADRLLEQDIAPWFEKNWAADRPIQSHHLHNYVLILFRAAQLARVRQHPLRPALEDRAEDVFRAWCVARHAPSFHSEGTAYDGYLLDSVTEWLEGLPQAKQDELRDIGQEALCGFARQAIALTLPGRVDLQTPLGDVEPEMVFWANALIRVARWYDLSEAGWLLRRFFPARLRVAGLTELIEHHGLFEREFPAPPPGVHEQLASLALRTGWQASDCLVAVSLPRCGMGHLHPDAGHVVIGWQKRFWITDPGYQQYRPGEERVYTLGPQSHNLPVIGAVVPSRLDGRLLEQHAEQGECRAVIDLSPAYTGLSPEQKIYREIILQQQEGGIIVRVVDTFEGFAVGTQVTYHWLGGNYLAWAFRDGWARLSDGTSSLWIGCQQVPIAALCLDRHPGSRGPLMLVISSTLPGEGAAMEWTFHLNPEMTWTPPQR